MRFVFQAQSIGRGGWVGGKNKKEREIVDSPTKTNICEQTIKNDKKQSERKDSNNAK